MFSKGEKILLSVVGSLAVIAILFAAWYGPIYRENIFFEKSNEAVSINDTTERALTQKLSETVKESGVTVRNKGFVIEKKGDPYKYIFLSNDDIESIPLENVNPNLTIQFDTDDWCFKNI